VYVALYGPKGSVIFDHPYNADSERLRTEAATDMRAHRQTGSGDAVEAARQGPLGPHAASEYGPLGGRPSWLTVRRGPGGRRQSDHLLPGAAGCMVTARPAKTARNKTMKPP